MSANLEAELRQLPRRDALDQFSYNKASIGNLLDGDPTNNRLGLDQLRNADLAIAANQQALIDRVAEI